jgi:hypothetical protein
MWKFRVKFLLPELMVFRIGGKLCLQEFCVLQVALATQTVDPVQPIPPPGNQVRVEHLRRL